MNKKLITAILGVGMGLASLSAFSGTNEQCDFIKTHCLNTGTDAIVCQARYELCIAGIWY